MEKKSLTIKDGALAGIFGFLICQLAVVIFTALCLIVCRFANLNTEAFMSFIESPNTLGYIFCVLVLDLSLVIYCFYKSKKHNYILVKREKISLTKVLLYICLTLCTFIILAPATLSFNELLIKWGLKPVELHLTLQGYILGIVSLVILPAIGEELLLRGTVLKGLKSAGFAISVVVSAVMFALFHMSIFQLIFPIGFGLLFGVIMFKENNIIYTIIAHATNNFLALSVSYFNINLMWTHWSYYVVAVVLGIAYFTLMALYISKQNKKYEKQKLSTNDKLTLILTLVGMGLLWLLLGIA